MRVCLYRCCIVFVLTASLFLTGCSASYVKAPDSCRSSLGSPISRFCQVTQGALWRGAQPDKEGIAWLIEHGVKTIVNLELFHDDLSLIEQVDLVTPKSLRLHTFASRIGSYSLFWPPRLKMNRLSIFSQLPVSRGTNLFMSIAVQDKTGPASWLRLIK